MSDLIGKRVMYHGSLKYLHGEMTVEKEQTPEWLREGDVRYLLVYGNKMHDYLVNVRRESFTVIEDEDGHA